MRNKVLIKHGLVWGLDEKKVRGLALSVLGKFGFKGVELSLFFVGRNRARSLNMKYRKMGYVPQVLAFPLDTERDSDGLMRLGDIVICNEKLKYESGHEKEDVYVILEAWLEHGLQGLGKEKKRTT